MMALRILQDDYMHTYSIVEESTRVQRQANTIYDNLPEVENRNSAERLSQSSAHASEYFLTNMQNKV